MSGFTSIISITVTGSIPMSLKVSADPGKSVSMEPLPVWVPSVIE